MIRLALVIRPARLVPVSLRAAGGARRMFAQRGVPSHLPPIYIPDISMRSIYARSRGSALVVLACAAAACTDRNPAVSAGPQPELPPSAMAMMTCTVAVEAGTMACGAPGVAPGISAAVLGGQGTHVRLTSTGMSYDGTSTFRMDVTVENLTAQAMGTADGTTPSADGVRIFFHSGPTATGGQGTVAVANADGDAFFITAGQKYFQYDGILPPGDTTPAKEWRFTLPNTVTSFTFGVYVAGPVRAEEGWIGMSPIAASVAVGDTQRIVGTVRSPTGGAVDGAVTWSTSHPAIATVNGAGLVTGVAAGTATITATSGGRTGSVQVIVHPAVFDPPPTFLNLRVDGASLTSGVHDALRYRLEYRNTGGYSPYIRVTVRHSTGLLRECLSHTGFGWIGENREFTCVSGFPDGILGGAWKIDRIDFAGRTITHAALVAAGAPAWVHVHTPDEDHDAPTLDSMVLQLDTVDGGSGFGPGLNLWARDRMWTDRAEAFISSAGNPRLWLTGHSLTGENGVTPYYFPTPIPYYYHGGTFTLDSLRLRDSNGNRRTIRRDSLAARGYRTQFEVINTLPDTVPPAYSAYSFSTDTVVGNGADSLTVFLAAEETVDESGVRSLEIEFEFAADTTRRRRCSSISPTRGWYLEMTCRLAFSAEDAGTWRVRYARAIDFMDNRNILWTADILALGIPVELTVLAP